MGFIPGIQGWFSIQKIIKVIQHISGTKTETKTKTMINYIDTEKTFAMLKKKKLKQ